MSGEERDVLIRAQEAAARKGDQKNMKAVKLRNLVLGEGIPKICVPFVGKNEKELMEEAGLCRDSSADLVEWRADWLENDSVKGETGRILSLLRESLEERPLLFTYRRKAEGGNGGRSLPDYEALLTEMIETEQMDAVDVELSAGSERVQKMIEKAHDRGVRVIVSKHDFSKTLSREEILSSLRQMQELGADVAKIAMMPRSREDVLVLLSATAEASSVLDVPVITMSMGGQGLVSRLAGEVFGSCLTFGALQAPSAPGQIDAGELKQVLEVIHRAL